LALAGDAVGRIAALRKLTIRTADIAAAATAVLTNLD
jgi:hypothetical protein